MIFRRALSLLLTWLSFATIVRSQGFTLAWSPLTQCGNASIAWTGPANQTKHIQVFVKGDAFFYETLDSSDPHKSASGTFEWEVDIIAGLVISAEIHDDTSANWYTTPYQTILPGSTDACLGQNSGQTINSTFRASRQASMSSSSPGLFTYAQSQASTTSVTSPTSSGTSGATTRTSTSSISSPTSGAATSSTSHVGPIVGGVIGGMAAIAIFIALYAIYRHRKTKGQVLPVDNKSTPSPPYHYTQPGPSEYAASHRPPSSQWTSHPTTGSSQAFVPEIQEEGSGYGYMRQAGNVSRETLSRWQ